MASNRDMENRRAKVMKISGLDARHGRIRELLSCPICKKLLREVTAIDECLHKFCRACITNKLTEERLHNCPVCKVDLGVAPLQKLKADYSWQTIRNSIKFKRRTYIERGLIQPKVKKPQASEKAKEPEVLPSDSLLVRRKEKSPIIKKEKSPVRRKEKSPVRRQEKPPLRRKEKSPLRRKEKSPLRRKEKSISSVLSAEKASTTQSPANGKRKSGGRKALPPRRASFSGVPPIEEPEYHQQISSNPGKKSNGAPGRKQRIKPSKQELSDDKQQRDEQSEGMNALLKPLDSLVGVAGTSKPNMSGTVQSAPSDAHCIKENQEKGKRKEQTDNSRGQHDEKGSISLPSGSEQPRSVRRAEEKRPVVTADLNLPAKDYLDASSSKMFRENDIWFTLAASDNQESYLPLPPLPPAFLMIRQHNMPASYIKKYLVRKLRLHREEEVELSLRGRPISSDCQLHKMVEMWKQTTPWSEKKGGTVGGSGKEIVMVVTYARRAYYY